MKLYAIMDLKVKEALLIIPAKNDNAIRRDWEVVVNKKDSVYNKYPEDYAVFRICDYDADTMKISGVEQTMVVTAREVYHASHDQTV